MGLKSNETAHRPSGNTSINMKIPKSTSEHAGTLIRVLDFDPAKHLLKVVKMADNKPLEPDAEVDSANKRKKPYDEVSSKILKTSLAADGPIIEANDNSVSMRGNADFGFYSFREGGANIIKGPLSIATEPHQIRISGLTTLNPLVTSGFASTIVTPVPMTIWSLPTAAMIKPLLQDVLIMGTIYAASAMSGAGGAA